ncbi:carbohydrate porin [Psychromonas antarctica]|uniref:carbohydrate porin n=1 Tax=Psychromonas antarctica TaxID=67573 RepID=UPI001EE8180D|nr:carbohydrate porin [Psychromonas antarctica]MCG6201098.1 carbohydrate porin [Psychromonas antarctica]
MKLSKLTLACLLATSGFAVTSGANAEVTDGLEFHGYFRSGVILSVEDDLQRAKYPASKEQLGRLGIESDNDMSFELVKKWAFDDGKNIRIHVAVAGTGDDKALGSSVDAGGVDNSMGFGQTYVEFAGLTETGTFWAGKRDYGKDNYIFMTDFFYTQMSGLGLGVSDYEIGDTKFDFAYMSTDRNGNAAGRWGDNTNNLMHSVHVGANFGSFELHGQVKAMTDNWDSAGNEYAETGADLTAIVHLDSFLGLPGNGFSKIIGQVGVGLGSHQLLGGTLNVYNGWVAGGPGPDQMSYVDDGDVSARFLLWGGYFLENGINLFPALQAQYNDNDDGSSDYWMSAMIRPTFPVSDNFMVATEFGTQYNHYEGDGYQGSGNNAKITIAPTWVIGTGQGPAPEIRLLGTYLNHAGTNNGDDDFIVGIQADMWW